GFSAIVIASLLFLTRYWNFFYDEWDFVSWYRPSQSTSIWTPHNEHWSTIPILVWKGLFAVFGLSSHVPYEAALLAAHTASVFLLFVYVRRRSGDLLAFAAAATLLVLGSGAADIVWAFQLGFVASVAFGLVGLLIVDGESRTPLRIGTASAALLASLMCSGV